MVEEKFFFSPNFKMGLFRCAFLFISIFAFFNNKYIVVVVVVVFVVVVVVWNVFLPW